MAARSRKRGRGGEGGEHENSERWLLTYADMITLLVAFFMMLYAMSITNPTKFQQLAISVRSGFGGSMHNGATTILTGGGNTGKASIVSNSSHSKSGSVMDMKRQGKAAADAAALDKAMGQMLAYIRAHHLEKLLTVRNDRRGVIVTVMTDQMFFSRARADLMPASLPLMAKVAEVMNHVPNPVCVEGYTDNLPIHNAQYASNWELSCARAATVMRVLRANHVPDSRLEGAFFADQHPVAPNDTEERRQHNRRVEIVIKRLYAAPHNPLAPTLF